MREAKSLGIPLRQPGTGPGRVVRRSSISQLTDGSDNHVDVWACSHCHRTVVDMQPPRAAAHRAPPPATAPVLPRNAASPFKDVFRLAGIFGRKVKDGGADSRSKVKQALTLPRGHGAAAWTCDACSGKAAPEVTSSPCSRRHVTADGARPTERGKYRRSASTPRPAGDAALHLLHPGTARTHAAGTTHQQLIITRLFKVILGTGRVELPIGYNGAPHIFPQNLPLPLTDSQT